MDVLKIYTKYLH